MIPNTLNRSKCSSWALCMSRAKDMTLHFLSILAVDGGKIVNKSGMIWNDQWMINSCFQLAAKGMPKDLGRFDVAYSMTCSKALQARTSVQTLMHHVLLETTSLVSEFEWGDWFLLHAKSVFFIGYADHGQTLWGIQIVSTRVHQVEGVHSSSLALRRPRDIHNLRRTSLWAGGEHVDLAGSIAAHRKKLAHYIASEEWNPHVTSHHMLS